MAHPPALSRRRIGRCMVAVLSCAACLSARAEPVTVTVFDQPLLFALPLATAAITCLTGSAAGGSEAESADHSEPVA